MLTLPKNNLALPKNNMTLRKSLELNLTLRQSLELNLTDKLRSRERTLDPTTELEVRAFPLFVEVSDRAVSGLASCE